MSGSVCTAENFRIRKIHRAVTVFLLIVEAAYIFMMVYTCFFTHYYSDDCSYLNGARTQFEDGTVVGYLSGVWESALDKYLTWQGCWFTNILVYLLYGFQVFGIRGLQLSIAVIVLLTFLSFLYLLWEIVQRFNTEYRLLWFSLLTALVIGAGMSTTSPSQFYYWITVVYSYTLPFACGVFGIALYLKYARTGRKWCMAVSLILGTLSCGGPLTNTALFAAVYMGIFLYRCAVDKRIAGLFGIPFYGALVGALVNALAPGNFDRRTNYISDTWNLAETCLTTLSMELSRWQVLLSSFVIGACILLIAAALMHGKGLLDTRLNPVWGWLYTFFTGYLMFFPLVLGYDGDEFVPERVTYGWDLAMAVMFLMCGMYTACWLCNRGGLKSMFTKTSGRKPIILAAGCIIMLVNIVIVGPKNTYVVRQVVEYKNGLIQEYYAQMSEIYDTIAESEEDDVTVIVTDFPYTLIMPELSLTDDSTNWINKSTATHYYKSSVTVIQE